jgi:hypothetical protein
LGVAELEGYDAPGEGEDGEEELHLSLPPATELRNEPLAHHFVLKHLTAARLAADANCFVLHVRISI